MNHQISNQSKPNSSQSLDQNIIFDNLTNQELKVLKLASQDFSNKEIANKLCIAVSTAKKHRENISRKFSIHGKVAVRKFLRLCTNIMKYD